MQDKIKNIESVYQSQLSNLYNWREQALIAVHLEYSQPVQPLPLPPKKIINLKWKESESKLKELHKIIVKENIVDQQEQDYDVHFSPHFYEGRIIISEIKCKSIIKALWFFYVLQQIDVITITNETLHIALPQHCTDKRGKSLNPDTLETYLTRIRKAKSSPNFIRDMLLIFPSESLPKSLLK